MNKTLFARIFVAIVLLINSFGPIPLSQAQDLGLPAPGVMVHLSPAFDPPLLKGIKVHADAPFQLDFILDKGDSLSGNDQLKDESTKLVKYFLAGLTIPEKDLWVNLSPYEKDRVIPVSFGLTEMGRDLLAQDYILKQITSSLLYPEGDLGKKFWKRVYEEAARRYGTTDIDVNTFNKVWILPEKAVVYENIKAGTAYVVESKFKVMLEQDYLALKNDPGARSGQAQEKDTDRLGREIVREIVIPELTKEVNAGKNFAPLRQVYNSLILAVWYKKKIKDSLLSQGYADKNKVAGINIDDPREKEKIYQRYLQAFKNGVYHYIKEDADPVTRQPVPRKYFSGGIPLYKIALTEVQDVPSGAMISRDHAMEVTANLGMFGVLKRSKRERNLVASLAAVIALAVPVDISYRSQLNDAVRGVSVRIENALMDQKISSMAELNVADIHNPADRETILRARDLVDRSLGDPQGNIYDIYNKLQILAYRNSNISQVINHSRGSGEVSLTPEQDIVWRHFIAQLARYSYGSWLNSIGIKDGIFKKQAGEYLAQRTFLGYWNASPGYQNAGGIYINLSVVDLSVMAGTLSHETKHFFARAANRSDDSTYTRVKTASGIQGGDDNTWLLASSSGYLQGFLVRGGLMGEHIERGNSPLATHEMLRDIFPRGMTWSQQARFIEKKYRPGMGDVDTTASYSQGELLAIYEFEYFGPEASDYFDRLYGTRHGQMNIAQIELAVAVKKSLVQNYYLQDLSMPDLENIIIDEVMKTPFAENISYKELSVKQGAILNETIARLGQHVISKSEDALQKGGIDLTPAESYLQIQNAGQGIKFQPDPVLLQQFLNSPGLVPVIINIRPMTDLGQFLGLNVQ